MGEGKGRGRHSLPCYSLYSGGADGLLEQSTSTAWVSSAYDNFGNQTELVCLLNINCSPASHRSPGQLQLIILKRFCIICSHYFDPSADHSANTLSGRSSIAFSAKLVGK